MIAAFHCAVFTQAEDSLPSSGLRLPLSVEKPRITRTPAKRAKNPKPPPTLICIKLVAPPSRKISAKERKRRDGRGFLCGAFTLSAICVSGWSWNISLRS